MTGVKGELFPAKTWAGPSRCQGTTRFGERCNEWEIDGLEFCIRHVPDDLIEEAEEIVGVRLCKVKHTPPACRNFAVEGSEPPRCTTHGAAAGSFPAKGAAMNAVENHMTDRLAALMAANWEKLANPEPVGNPLDEMLRLAAEIKAMKDVLRDAFILLWQSNKVRYAHSKAGEQLRVEILLYERSLERLGRILLDISKLKIEERLAGIRQQTADMLERALDAALEESGVGLEGKASAREALHRHLRIVALSGEGRRKM